MQYKFLNLHGYHDTYYIITVPNNYGNNYCRFVGIYRNCNDYYRAVGSYRKYGIPTSDLKSVYLLLFLFFLRNIYFHGHALNILGLFKFESDLHIITTEKRYSRCFRFSVISNTPIHTTFPTVTFWTLNVRAYGIEKRDLQTGRLLLSTY